METHRPDLPISPWTETTAGLGLWNSISGTIAVEGGLFLLCVAIYLRSTAAKDRAGTYALWSLIGFLVLVWIVNMLGPPPPNETAVAFSALLLWLIVPWVTGLTDTGEALQGWRVESGGIVQKFIDIPMPASKPVNVPPPFIEPV